MKSLANKFLVVKPGVVLTKHIDQVIYELDLYFQAANLKAFITSGLRDAMAQLRIIRGALVKMGIADEYADAFEDINRKVINNGQEIYTWQLGWSRLLNLNYIVNPPFPAEVLMNYYRPGSKNNSKGTIIQSSPHFKGTAFDIGGGLNGISDEMAIVESALGKVKGIKDYLPERTNNCLHVNVFTLESYAS
jgi:hypothetical protein